MVDFTSDHDPFETPIDAANEDYAQTPRSWGARAAAQISDFSPVRQIEDIAQQGSYAGSSRLSQSLLYGLTHPEGMPDDPDAPKPGTIQTPMLTPEDYNKRYAPIGQDGKQVSIGTESMPEGVAQAIGKAKAAEIEREGVLAQYGAQHPVLSFGTGMAAFLMDPINAATMFIPGLGEEALTARLGTGLAGRTLARVIAGGSAGAAAQAPVIALHYGLGTQEASDYGLRSAFRDMAFGASASAILHAGFGSLADILRGRHGVAPEAPLVTAETPLAEVEHAPPPDAEAILTADAATQHSAISTSVAQIADGREVDVSPILPHVAPPIASLSLPPRPESIVPAIHENIAGSAYAMVDPAELTLDPSRFQYKEANERGVTGALGGVTKWEPTLANPITAWRADDGKLYVINGHQRTDLAQRATEAGQEGVKVPARIFNEADGYSADFMRTLGAYQNIAEGSGTAIDAAKILRDRGAFPENLQLPGLPPKSQLVEQARGLAALGEHSFGMVVNDIVPAAYAAEVGRAIRDPAEQLAAMDALAKALPANLEQARLMVADIKESGFLKGAQTTLFGERTFAQSLFAERARILENSMRGLRRLMGTFRTAVEQEGALSGAGNVMSREANVAGRTANESLLETLRANGTRRGAISDALTDAARNLKAGRPISTTTSEFLARARELERHGGDQGVQYGADVGRNEPPPATATELAARQRGIYRDGFAPGLTSGDLSRADSDLFGQKEPATGASKGAVTPANAEGKPVTPEEHELATLETARAESPFPKTVEEQVELDRTATAMADAKTSEAAFVQAAQCLTEAGL